MLVIMVIQGEVVGDGGLQGDCSVARRKNPRFP
jgi:hypothetical protein